MMSFEQEGLEKPYLCRQTEIGIYHFMTEENWYDLVKDEADLDGFFAGTDFQYLWIGDERERKPCGLTIFPVEEDLLKYSFREMDRLPEGQSVSKTNLSRNLSEIKTSETILGVDQYLPAVDRRRTGLIRSTSRRQKKR